MDTDIIVSHGRTLLAFAGLTLLCSASACGNSLVGPDVDFRASEAATCGAADDPSLVRKSFLERLFPDSSEPQDLFCALDSKASKCEVQATNLSAPVAFGGAVPSVAQCKAASGPALQSCDRYAKHMITRGLAEGELIAVLRGAARLRDVMVSGEVPSYYKLGAPQNRFVNWLASAGIDPAALGSCTEGSIADGYSCLAASPAPPHRTLTRGLLELMERHNGVLARTKGLAGVADRQAAIFASATGPMSTYLARTGDFAPTANYGVQRVDALARYFALRVLNGTAGVETDAFAELPSFRPPGHEKNPLLTAGLGVLAAQVAAYGWNDKTDALQVNNAVLASDLNDYFAILDASAQTAAALGECGVGTNLRLLRSNSARLNLAALPMEREFVGSLLNSTNSLSWDRLNEVWDATTNQLIDSCGMHQTLVAATVTRFTEIEVDAYNYNPGTIWICEVGDDLYLESIDQIPYEITGCDCTARDYDQLGGGSGGCEEWLVEIQIDDEFEEWLDYGEELAAEAELDAVLGSTITVEEVRAAYNDLIDSHRTDAYDVDEDGTPDLSHNENPDAHVSILEASVEWSQCRGELQAATTAYAQTEFSDVSCDPADGVTSSCRETYDGIYVPYAVASRVCPLHLAHITGVDRDSAWMHECSTPWSFTKAVQYFLEHDDVPQSVIEDYPAKGRQVRPLLADFAAEALHLSQPAAAIRSHRADLASVAGHVATASDLDPEDWYSANVGFDVMEGHLDEGERIMGAGLDLVADFEGTQVWGHSGTRILSGLSGGGFERCVSQGCDENGRYHARALFYRRLRDAIETYNRLSTDRLEAKWRRLDGSLCVDTDGSSGYNDCRTCLYGVDQDGDEVDDVVACDPNADLDGDDSPDCAEQCQHFGDAWRIASLGGQRMETLGEMLDQHSGRSSLDAEQQDFAASAAAYAHSVGRELDRRHAAMTDGVDWLGFRQGQWYPGLWVDPDAGLNEATDHLDQKFTEIEFALGAANYDAFVEAYYNQVSGLADWASDVEDNFSLVRDSVSGLCGGSPGSCDVEWGDDFDPVAGVNDKVDAFLCQQRLMVLFYYVDGAGPLPLEVTLGTGAEDCPEPLQSPDFDALPASGSIPIAAGRMRLTLVELSVALADLQAYMELIEQNNSSRIEISQMIAGLENAERKRERLKDIMTCAAAGIGAAAATIGGAACTAASAGGCTPLSAVGVTAAWSGAATTCAQTQADSEWVSKAPTRKEFERAFQEYTMSLQVHAEEYTLATKVGVLFTLLARYEAEITGYLTEQAELLRTTAYGNTALDNLVTDPLRDPSFQLFDQDLSDMKSAFEDTAGLVREARSLMAYDIGQSVREGAVFETAETAAHYLPRLAEITSVGDYEPGFDSALSLLEVHSGRDDVENPPRAYNLESYASLLKHVHGEFTALYGGSRSVTDAPIFLSHPDTGMPAGTDLPGNPGELAMLGDSKFYNPRHRGDSVCVVGEVDLHDYCSNFADTGYEVPVGTCLDVDTLTFGERYDLVYTDHLVRGVGVETFTCYDTYNEGCLAWDEDSICIEPIGERSPHVEVANGDAGLTFDALRGSCPGCAHDDEIFYDAQTKVVRNIIDRFRADQSANPNTLGDDALNAQPGTFLWLVNMAPNRQTEGRGSATLDIEADLLYNAYGAPNTTAEHLASVVLVCNDENACPGQELPLTDFIFLGDGFLGSRCQEVETGRQERVRFRMDASVQTDLTALKETDAGTFLEQIDIALSDPQRVEDMSAQPLQGGSWIVALHAYAQPNGQPLSQPWTVDHGGADYGPRVDLALRYSYYDGHPQSGDYEYSVAGLLECHGGSDATLCVPPMCS